MLHDLVRFFSNPVADHQLPEEAAQIAVAALLVAAARADDEYDVEEMNAITRVLGKYYSIEKPAAERLRVDGESAYEKAPDIVRFTRAIKHVVPIEERVKVIEAIWEVAYADGARDHTESALVRKLCGLLYVEDRDAGLARQRVKARLGLG
ncbi:TerB family tellurite resistance protein [Rhodobacteraceae bacterium NNCM2]|nr:TerB family tellurite resistance protein [Coraliihabitans acroporae]